MACQEITIQSIKEMHMNEREWILSGPFHLIKRFKFKQDQQITRSIISIIWGMWSDTRGSTEGGRQWRYTISWRNSSQYRLLKLIGSSPNSFARAIIYRIRKLQLSSSCHTNIEKRLATKLLHQNNIRSPIHQTTL
jgi:hypothetical protein